ncbi:MAG TPA: phage holin family protein [Verrucomicrobiae bacterium]|nr:phage holin family protein [Verrucomicrobiae bacterium]
MIAEDQIPTLGRLARRTTATILGALQNRAELLAVEFEEEHERMLKLVLFGISALFFAMLTVLLITATVIFLVPEEYRVYATLGFAVLYLLGTVAAIFVLKGLLKRTPFAESLDQFKKDAELLDAIK